MVINIGFNVYFKQKAECCSPFKREVIVPIILLFFSNLSEVIEIYSKLISPLFLGGGGLGGDHACVFNFSGRSYRQKHSPNLGSWVIFLQSIDVVIFPPPPALQSTDTFSCTESEKVLPEGTMVNPTTRR